MHCWFVAWLLDFTALSKQTVDLSKDIWRQHGQLEAVTDPEVLSRGGELRGHEGGGALPKNFEFKSKNDAVLCTFKY